MKVTLIRAARIRHNAGEIVEVSPAEAGFLMSTGSAVRYAEPVQAEEPKTPEAIETPEAEEEAPEIPEKAVKASKATPEKAAAPKTTRKKK